MRILKKSRSLYHDYLNKMQAVENSRWICFGFEGAHKNITDFNHLLLPAVGAHSEILANIKIFKITSISSSIL